LEPLVVQVLDATYSSATIDFTSAPAPFDDAEAIKVINGIVRTGEIPNNSKPTKETSASENYGYALGIMKKTGVKKLDTDGCVFVEDVEEWVEAQIGEGGGSIPVPSLYKNFTGIGGPNAKNYGLSRRMIDVYLLSLVRHGKLRVSLSGKATNTAEYIDYSNSKSSPSTPPFSTAWRRSSSSRPRRAGRCWPRTPPSSWTNLRSRRSSRTPRSTGRSKSCLNSTPRRSPRSPHWPTV
jgi:hypothetical protein